MNVKVLGNPLVVFGRVMTGIVGDAVVESSTFLLVGVVGLVANGVLCAAIFTSSSLRRLPTISYIAALAIADLFSGLNAIVFPGTTLAAGRWMFGHVGCQINGFVTFFFILISAGTVALLAVNRYIRCVHQTYYGKVFKPNRSMIFVAILWSFVSGLLLVPFFCGQAEIVFLREFAACTPEQVGVYFIFLSAAFLLFCFLTIIFCYRKVYVAIRKIKSTVAPLQESDGSNHVTLPSSEVQMTKAIILIVMAYLICWCPIYVIAVSIKGFGVESHFAGLVAIFLLNLSTSINPLIYGLTNRTIRMEIKKLFCCWHSRRRDSQ